MSLSEIGRKYGAVKDSPDIRDLGMLRFAAPKAAPLPSKISHRNKIGPIRDQGNLGSCTGHAGCAHREFLYNQYRKYEKYELAPELVNFSPLYLYYRERELEGTIEYDGGAQMRSIVKCLNKWGVCLETTDPYKPKEFKLGPSSEETAEGFKYKSGAYHRLSTVDDMKACLAYGSEEEQYTFVLGFGVYQSFESNQVRQDGLMPMPRPGHELSLGGHAVHVIGYDDSVRCPGTDFAGAFEVQNSWGPNWGNGGCFWLPFQAAARNDLVFDCWMSHLGKAW